MLFFPNLAFSLSDGGKAVPGCRASPTARPRIFRWITPPARCRPASLTGEKAQALAAMIERFGSQAAGLVQDLLPYRPCRTRPHLFPPGAGQGPALFQDQRRPAAAHRCLSLPPDAGPAHPALLRQCRARLRRATGMSANLSRILRAPSCRGWDRICPASPGCIDKLGVTRGRRSLYDELMLSLHDAAKLDAAFQQEQPAPGRSNFRPAPAGWSSPIRCCMPPWAGNSPWSRPSISMSAKWPSPGARRSRCWNG